MAKATEKFTTVEKIVTEEVRDGVTLELTDSEARAIQALVARSVGNTFYSLYDALHEIYDHIPRDEYVITGVENLFSVIKADK